MKIPAAMEHLARPGEMSGKLEVYDFPLLSMVMVNLQNDQAQGAGDYAELGVMPEHMKHLVGDVQVCPSVKTHTVRIKCGNGIIDEQERRVRSSGQWVLYPVISAQQKVTVRGGKTFVKKQFSGFVERYFSPAKVVEDEEEVLKL
jgi:hypothetical protein